MQRLRPWIGLLLLCSLTGCGPVIAEVLEFDEDSESSEPDGPGTNEDTSVEQEDESGPRTVTSGTWTLVDASLIDDPCGWMSALVNVTTGVDYTDEPLTFDVFLPSQFDVSAAEGRFDIKAANYGARDYIECTFIADDFACTTQSVDAIPVLSGASDWPRYWIYQIDFSGSYVDNNTLTGDALVTFPKINPGDAYNLGVSGLGLKEDCPQTYRLTLAATTP